MDFNVGQFLGMPLPRGPKLLVRRDQARELRLLAGEAPEVFERRFALIVGPHVALQCWMNDVFQRGMPIEEDAFVRGACLLVDGVPVAHQAVE